MKQKHVVIVGGVAGGASAAARARRHSETARITVIERGPDVSFANCGLPYPIGREIHWRGNREELTLQTPESLRKLLNLKVQTSTEVTAIDPAAKTVTLRSLLVGTISTFSYDELILSPGASPLRSPLPGIDHEKNSHPSQYRGHGPDHRRSSRNGIRRGDRRRIHRSRNGGAARSSGEASLARRDAPAGSPADRFRIGEAASPRNFKKTQNSTSS